jgi:hypothetical protein
MNGLGKKGTVTREWFFTSGFLHHTALTKRLTLAKVIEGFQFE